VLDRDKQLDLEVPDGEIAGIVLTAEDQQPLAGVSVNLVGLQAVPIEHQVTTKFDGRFAISDLPDGTYAVLAESREYGRVETQVDLKNGFSQELSLVLKPQPELVLVVHKPDGSPPNRISAYYLLTGTVVNSVSADCDQQARCRLLNLPDGLSALMIRETNSSAFIMVSPSMKEVPVTLRKNGNLSIRAISDSSSSSWQATVTAAETTEIVLGS